MNKHNRAFIGYRPGQVCELLGISNETFRYWREHLYPEIDRKDFNLDDIFIYHFIKSFVKIRRVKVSELKKINWQKVYEHISKLDNNESMTCIAIFDTDKKIFLFANTPDDYDLSDDKYISVYMKNIINRFNDSINNFGTEGTSVSFLR